MARRAKPRGPLPPGSVIGMLGSGQLARMLITAAARLGLKVHVYADHRGPACDVAAATTIAPYEDVAALAAFAAAVDVVTYEFENVPTATAALLAKHVPVRPGAKALEVSQDRLVEKTFISNLGIAVAPFEPVETAADLEAALAKIGAASILKTRRLGYDGKGQIGVKPGADVAAAFAKIGSAPAVLEKRLAFAQEISVLVCRATDATVQFYDIPQNTHGGGILRRSTVPAPLTGDAVAAARDIAARIAAALDYVGLLAVELFDLGPKVPLAQRLVVNEIAPRVHNSGHWTIEACAISQFENHMRAVADWPLGSAERHSDAEMHNIIGDEIRAWKDLAADSTLAVHLYGKNDARPGRKMGHTTRLFPRGTRGDADLARPANGKARRAARSAV
jgi:5-(carboxyamino)imidazole ribonucleotide synthase